MTLKELEYLIAVAKYRHFGQAADACFVTQPTLSTQLKKLEQELGSPLFERDNKTVEITAFGQQILQRAHTIIDEVTRIKRDAQAQETPLSGPLKLGVIPTLGPYFLPWFLAALQRDYPEAEPVLVEDLTHHLVAALQAHEIDIAVLALPIDVDSLASMALFEEPFLAAVPSAHKLCHESAVSYEDLREEKLLFLADGHCMRDQALEICHLSSEQLSHGDFRAVSLESLRQLVAAGLGITLLPALAAQERHHSPDISLRPLCEQAHRSIGLLFRKTHPRIDDVHALAALIRANLPQCVQAHTPV